MTKCQIFIYSIFQKWWPRGRVLGLCPTASKRSGSITIPCAPSVAILLDKGLTIHYLVFLYVCAVCTLKNPISLFILKLAYRPASRALRLALPGCLVASLPQPLGFALCAHENFWKKKCVSIDLKCSDPCKIAKKKKFTPLTRSP